MYWLVVSVRLMMRPAENAAPTRRTRISPRSGSTPTSTNTAPKPDTVKPSMAAARVDASTTSVASPSSSSRRRPRRAVIDSLAGSALGCPRLGGSRLALIVEPAKERVSGACPKSGERGSSAAIVASLVRSWLTAVSMAGTMLAVTCEPADDGPCGSRVSPASTWTWSCGSPSAWAASWASTVDASAPTSGVPHWTMSLASGVSARRTAQSWRRCG